MSELSREFPIWWSLVWPTMITNFSRLGMELTDVLVLGHYQKGVYLSSASYASIALSSVLVVVSRGMGGSVVRALCSTAYGAGNFRLMGQWLQIALLFASSVALLLMPLCFWGGDILGVVVGKEHIQPSEVDDINLFLRISLLWVMPRCWNGCLDSYLSAQKVVFPQMFISLAGFFLNIGFNFSYVYGFGFGFPGSPLATVTSRWFTFCSLIIYLRCRPLTLTPGTWNGFSMREATEAPRVKHYLKQAVPAALSGVIEEYQLQAVSVFAGKLGPDVVATHNSFFTCLMLLCSIMWSLMDSTTTRMGHHLGNHSMAGMKNSMKVGSISAIIWGLLVSGVSILFRKEVGEAISSNLVVEALAHELSALVGTCFFLLAIFYIGMGILTAAFKQHLIVCAFILGAWGISVPLAWTFAFELDPKFGEWYPGRLKWDTGPDGHGLGFLGLWLGLAAGYLATTGLAWISVCRLNWVEVMDEAAKKAEASDAPQAGLVANSLDVSLTPQNDGGS